MSCLEFLTMKSGDRISKLMKAKGLRSVDVVRATGATKGAVSQWINDDVIPSGEYLTGLCSLLETTGTYLVKGKGPANVPQSLSDKYAPLPFWSIEVVGSNHDYDGFEIHFTEDESIEPYFYRRDWIAENGYREEALGGRIVKGSSMEPRLYEGDKVLINTDSKTPKHGKVFVLTIGGAPVVKRLKKIDGTWWITSDNPAHSYTDVQLENLKQIIGEVIEKSSREI